MSGPLPSLPVPEMCPTCYAPMHRAIVAPRTRQRCGGCSAMLPRGYVSQPQPAQLELAVKAGVAATHAAPAGGAVVLEQIMTMLAPMSTAPGRDTLEVMRMPRPGFDAVAAERRVAYQGFRTAADRPFTVRNTPGGEVRTRAVPRCGHCAASVAVEQLRHAKWMRRPVCRRCLKSGPTTCSMCFEDVGRAALEIDRARGIVQCKGGCS